VLPALRDDGRATCTRGCKRGGLRPRRVRRAHSERQPCINLPLRRRRRKDVEDRYDVSLCLPSCCSARVRQMGAATGKLSTVAVAAKGGLDGLRGESSPAAGLARQARYRHEQAGASALLPEAEGENQRLPGGLPARPSYPQHHRAIFGRIFASTEAAGRNGAAIVQEKIADSREERRHDAKAITGWFVREVIDHSPSCG